MSDSVAFEKTLHQIGERVTPQRMIIASVLQDSDKHITAEGIHAVVREKYPYVNLSTVYRTLDWLKRLGMVTETNMGEGCVCYHWAEKGKHHHLVCQACGSVLDIDEDLLSPLEDSVLRRYGFKVELSHLALFGSCQSCQTENSRH